MTLYKRWLILLSLTVVYSLGIPSVGFAQNTAALEEDDNWHYQVRPGDNIWSISRRLLTDWKRWPDIQARNNIERPRSIPPGTQLAIPREWLRRKPGPAAVSALSGMAFVTDKDRQPLSVGSTVGPGVVIETQPQATLQLTFVDGSTVTIHENARIVLEKLDTFEGTRSADVLIRLESGRIDADVRKRPDNDSRYNFQSPALISAIRGTKIRTALIGEGDRGTTEVLTGKVVIEAARGPVPLDKGFGIAADVGSEPEPPVALPEPPVPIDEGVPRRHLPVHIAFEPVDQAAAYRVRITPSDNPLAVLFESTAEGPGIDIADLADGDYLVLARAITDGGIEGFEARFPLVVDARPLAPDLLDPPRDEIIREDRTELRWTPVDGAVGYRLETSLSPGFEVLEHDLAGLDQAEFRIEHLNEGTIYWRVTAVDETGGPGPTSETGRVTYEQPPPPPDPRTVEVELDEHRLRLSLPSTGRTFRYQIARDAQFSDIVRDKTVERPVVSMAGLVPDTYHVRLLAYESDGYTSGFGPSREVDVPPWPYWPLIPLMALLALL